MLYARQKWNNLEYHLIFHQPIRQFDRYHPNLENALEGLKLYSNYTFTKAVAEAGDFEDKDLPFYSRHTANVGLGYKVNQWSVNADMFAQSKQHSPG